MESIPPFPTSTSSPSSVEPSVPVGISLAFIALAAAFLLFAILVLSGRRTFAIFHPDQAVLDLNPLLNDQERSSHPYQSDQFLKEVTFPSILSDKPSPTTALAVVKNSFSSHPDENPKEPPVADTYRGNDVQEITIRPPLPVAKKLARASLLPARYVLHLSPVVTRSKDALSRMAGEAVQFPSTTPSSEGADPDGYQLQITSFASLQDARVFVDQLRARGHKAYFVMSQVSGREPLYRVRIGPFPSKQAAAAYRVTFEAKEHIVPFLLFHVSHE
ncbi:SPOR domain-containing protein [Pajaroellobacter abortibovis]|uniref:SPOR domain-containing protein n=1 Tax=Pajaroellobacter abortibovis TaxID=1882918 RepID=A0A1L6MWX7_9BACT|nr:SPOR domain-containing protein [Pajaroellobacter abortibovis]APR99917.1 hypothetical protein BCY86_03900 [Pajaroellobacter abortibovis]